jgi:hypothetical protein
VLKRKNGPQLVRDLVRDLVREGLGALTRSQRVKSYLLRD